MRLILRHFFPERKLSVATEWRLLEMVYSFPQMLWSNLLLSGLMGLLAWYRMRDGWSAGWACTGIVLAVLRIQDYYSFPKRRPVSSLYRARLRFVCLACATGAFWGSSTLVLVVTDDWFIRLCVMNAQTVIVASAVIRNAPIAAAAFGQLAAGALPMLATCLLASEPLFKIYGGFATLYVLTAFTVTRHLNLQTVRLVLADEATAASSRREGEARAGLEAANLRLEAMAATDGLTSIPNRRCFDDTLRREWLRALRAGTGVSVLLIDIDRFKAYNDAFGHPSGDDCLRQVARCLTGAVRRPVDLVARYGGEEFAVLLPGADGFGAIDTGERMRAAVENLAMAGAMGRAVTISVGAAFCVPTPSDTPWSEDAPGQGIAALIACADAKLYEANRSGRNCVRGETVPVRSCTTRM